LIHILAREESLIEKEYEELIINGIKKNYKICSSEYLSYLIYYNE